jgi:photosystem II PsbU protein
MAGTRLRGDALEFCNVETSFRSVAVMKRLLAWFMGGVALAGLLLTLWLPGAAQAAERRNVADDKIAETAGKVDLNNSSVRRFQQYPGMYPTLAGKIVLGGPYASVDDVLKLDLTERQKELFEKYKDNFTVTPPSIALNEGFDRINDGVYR